MAASLALALAGCGSTPVSPGVETIRAEAPHALTGSDGSLLLAWGAVDEDGRADILVAHWGETPVRVQPNRSTAVAGRQVGPRIARLSSGRLVVSWVDRGRDPAGDILSAVSDDGGRTFAPAVRVNNDAVGTGQEYQDLAALPGGGLALVWLDERGSTPDRPNQKQVYFARSADGGETFEPSRPLTFSPDGVCTCCRPGIVASPDGTIHVVFRDRQGEELLIRATSLRAGEASFDRPVTISASGWRFLACPTDAPAIVLGPSGSVHVAWMDASSGEPLLWRAESRDGGRSYSRPIPLARRSGVGPAKAPAAVANLNAPTLVCCGPGETQSQPGRACWSYDSRWGFAAAWELSDGRIRCGLLGDVPSQALTPDSPPESSASSPQLVASNEGFSLIWVETRWAEPPGGGAPRPESLLRRARLRAPEGTLSMVP